MKAIKTAVFLSTLIVSPLSQAIPLLNPTDLDASRIEINFDELSNGTVVDSEYAALGVQVSGTQGLEGSGSTMPIIAYDWWDPIYIGNEANDWSGSVIFTFTDINVTQFGLQVIDAFDNWLSVYDANGHLIESVFANDAASEQFLGIDTQNLSISYAIVTGDYFAVDDVAFTKTTSVTPPPVQVSEPGTVVILTGGLAALFASRRRNTRHSSTSHVHTHITH